VAEVAVVLLVAMTDTTAHPMQVTEAVVAVVLLAPQVSQEVLVILLLLAVVVVKTQMVLQQRLLEQALAFLVLEAEAEAVTEEQVLLVL
jgi:hypothetical protein